MISKELEAYNIQIAALQNKQYQFEFEIQDKFFNLFEYAPVQKGNLVAQIDLDKSNQMLQLYFTIKGKVSLTCDRSLEEFDYPIELIKQRIIFKLGNRNEVISHEIEMIDASTSVINVAQYIYEFIILEIPIKKLHPRFHIEPPPTSVLDAEGNLLVYSTHLNEQVEEPDIIDPRWEALKKLKNKI
ncbi:MAG: DUF177 domain-containing protein [Microscillaceae bacterium]|nr:DUF177 domain-containing protein [Microscillaceae bacterium]MDW8460471.1 DUF177 domain-containing protein [Cytophagales bacterium]